MSEGTRDPELEAFAGVVPPFPCGEDLDPTIRASGRSLGIAAVRRGLTKEWTDQAVAYFTAFLSPGERAEAELAAARMRLPEFQCEQAAALDELARFSRYCAEQGRSVQRLLDDLVREGEPLYDAAMARGEGAVATALLAEYQGRADVVVNQAVANVTGRVR